MPTRTRKPSIDKQTENRRGSRDPRRFLFGTNYFFMATALRHFSARTSGVRP